MKKEFTETSLLRKSFSKPQFTVVKLAGADVISTSGGTTERYVEESTDDWFNN